MMVCHTKRLRTRPLYHSNKLKKHLWYWIICYTSMFLWICVLKVSNWLMCFYWEKSQKFRYNFYKHFPRHMHSLIISSSFHFSDTPFTSTMPSGRSPGWWNELFIYHPKKSINAPEARTQPGSDKWKCICRSCLPFHIDTYRQFDMEEIRMGKRTSLRTDDEIVSFCEYSPI